MLIDQFPTDNVLCSQPRRLATVGISHRVAEERGQRCGELDVGYHIGQTLVGSEKLSRILFCTTGMLWEKLKLLGVELFAGRRFLVIDEVHERSVETDLVLATVKQLMMTEAKHKHMRNVKVILMSATADAVMYEKYFNEVGYCRQDFVVSTVVIDNIYTKNTFRVQEKYLDNCFELAQMSPHEFRSEANGRKVNLKAEIEVAVKCISELCKRRCIQALVQDPKNVPVKPEDIGDVLVFLPRFADITSMHYQLHRLEYRNLEVVLLHSSLDAEHTLQKIVDKKNSVEKKKKAEASGQVTVYLSTDIAATSVTIPGVSLFLIYVARISFFGTTRNAQGMEKLYLSPSAHCINEWGAQVELVKGVAYFFVDREVLNKMPDFEKAKLVDVSLRNEVLSLVAANERLFHRPHAILQQTLNPPSIERTESAIRFLEGIKAIKRTRNANKNYLAGPSQSYAMLGGSRLSVEEFTATTFGECLSCLPMDIEHAESILSFGCEGHLFDGILFACVQNNSNKPVKLVPLDSNKLNFSKKMKQYSVLPGTDPDFFALGHLGAFRSWMDQYVSPKRFKRIAACILADENKVESDLLSLCRSCLPEKRSYRELDGTSFLMTVYESDKTEWCDRLELSFNSLHGALETVFTCVNHLILTVLKRVCKNVKKSRAKSNDGKELFLRLDLDFRESPEVTMLRMNLQSPESFVELKEKQDDLISVLKHFRSRESKANSTNIEHGCPFWQHRYCNKGSDCRNSHDPILREIGTPCIYHHHPSFKNSCRNGDACRFAHGETTAIMQEWKLRNRLSLKRDGPTNVGNLGSSELSPSSRCVELSQKLLVLDTAPNYAALCIGLDASKLAVNIIVCIESLAGNKLVINDAYLFINKLMKIKKKSRQASIPTNLYEQAVLIPMHDSEFLTGTRKCECWNSNDPPFPLCIGTKHNYFHGCVNQDIECTRIFWKVRNRPKVAQVDLFFKSAAALVFVAIEHTDPEMFCGSTEHVDLLIKLTMDYKIFYELNVLAVAASSFFDLIDVRPHNDSRDRELMPELKISYDPSIVYFDYLFRFSRTINLRSIEKHLRYEVNNTS